jgi:spectinomycin phosphotransferase
MCDDPGFQLYAITATLEAAYGIAVDSVAFLPIGLDPRAAVYEVRTSDGAAWFLKVHVGPIFEPGLLVPTALAEWGIANVVAPVRTRTGALACPFDGISGTNLTLFPFIRGESASAVGMSAAQWREFGSALRAIHDAGLVPGFRTILETESFALPSAARVRRLLADVRNATFEDATASSLAAFLRQRDVRIRGLLDRAETFGMQLRPKPFDLVLCHADIHLGNVLVGSDGRVHLVDWDGPPRPMIAPRERDLLFVVGSRIGRPVLAAEEAWFFEGYGDVAIDCTAIAYYRYERIVEDLGEFTESVLFDAQLSDDARAAEADIVKRFFEPDGAIDTAESVTLPRRAQA